MSPPLTSAFPMPPIRNDGDTWIPRTCSRAESLGANAKSAHQRCVGLRSAARLPARPFFPGSELGKRDPGREDILSFGFCLDPEAARAGASPAAGAILTPFSRLRLRATWSANAWALSDRKRLVE